MPAEQPTPPTQQIPSQPSPSQPSPGQPIPRRAVLAAGGVGAVGAVGAAFAGGETAHAAQRGELTGEPRNAARLSFGRKGTFKIIQFNDTQDDEQTDKRTVQLMERALDAEQPDFVVINGDVIADGCDSPLEVKQAINNVVWPMESRSIPWAVTFGNHDEDSKPTSGWDEARMLRFYQTYEHNLNADNIPGLTGTSNTMITVHASRGSRAAFALWLLDSGRYAPSRLAGQDFAGYPQWDWVRMDQVDWYRTNSTTLERRNRRPIPGLMFIHIALWEHRFMWWGSVDGRSAADAARGKARHGIVGERNEAECPGPFNSGLYNAIVDRGDVRGVFVGHDHVNTYVGDYYGVQLGYGPGSGFGTYGLNGAQRNRLRGCRVFELTESTDDQGRPDVDMTSRLVFASDFGIDLTANDQPMEPLPLAPAQQRD